MTILYNISLCNLKYTSKTNLQPYPGSKFYKKNEKRVCKLDTFVLLSTLLNLIYSSPFNPDRTCSGSICLHQPGIQLSYTCITLIKHKCIKYPVIHIVLMPY